MSIPGLECADVSFGVAFEYIKEHKAFMRLPKWKPDVKIRVQSPDSKSKMTHPYLYVESRFGKVPWIPTQVEMFSLDWEIYNE